MADDDARYRGLFADGGRRLDDPTGPLTARGFDVTRGPDPDALEGTDTDGCGPVVGTHDETTDPRVGGVAGVGAAGIHGPRSTRSLDADDWSQYGRYVVSTTAEAYGWDVTTTRDDRARFEITGVDPR